MAALYLHPIISLLSIPLVFFSLSFVCVCVCVWWRIAAAGGGHRGWDSGIGGLRCRNTLGVASLKCICCWCGVTARTEARRWAGRKGRITWTLRHCSGKAVLFLAPPLSSLRSTAFLLYFLFMVAITVKTTVSLKHLILPCI